MRLAALALGVLAGLVASLILGLGGLDAGALTAVYPHQLASLRFGLFAIANLGVLGAGVALAAPLAGAILMLLGALTWTIAALVLGHGPDFVLITPPLLLLAGCALAIVAHLRRSDPANAGDPDDDFVDEDPTPPPFEAETLPPADETYEPEDEEAPVTQVRAGFFGQGGTAMPARVEAGRPPQPALRDFDDQQRSSDDWRPGARRPPPRQASMFRQPDDDYEDDDESGLSRFARLSSGVLSFGLYAGLAGAAVLVIWSLRSAPDAPRPAVAKVDGAISSTAEAATPRAPLLSSAADEPSAELATAAEPVASSAPPPQVLVSSAPASSEVAPPPPSETVAAAGPLDVVDAAPSPSVAELPAPADASSAETPAATGPAVREALTPPAATTPPPIPFAMPAQIAAERAGGSPAPRRTTPSALKPAAADTGL